MKDKYKEILTDKSVNGCDDGNTVTESRKMKEKYVNTKTAIMIYLVTIALGLSACFLTYYLPL